MVYYLYAIIFLYIYKNFMGFPGCLVVKNPPVVQCQRSRFDLWVKKIPWRRKQQATPAFLPGESHGQESLVGWSPWGHKRVGHDTETKQQKASYLPNTACVHVCILSYVQLFATPWAVACQAPLTTEFSRQKYWSGFPVPTPGNLPNPGIETTSLVSVALASKFFSTAPLWKPNAGIQIYTIYIYIHIALEKGKSTHAYILVCRFHGL